MGDHSFYQGLRSHIMSIIRHHQEPMIRLFPVGHNYRELTAIVVWFLDTSGRPDKNKDSN